MIACQVIASLPSARKKSSSVTVFLHLSEKLELDADGPADLNMSAPLHTCRPKSHEECCDDRSPHVLGQTEGQSTSCVHSTEQQFVDAASSTVTS